MAELDIGQHCSFFECKQLDFLPFVCDGCKEIFCKEHQVKDRHGCPSINLSNADPSLATPYQTYSCSLADCKRTELVPVPCDKCHSNFCMLHRHGVDHRCSSVVVKPKYMSATADHVKSIIDSKPSKITKQKAPKSKKAAALAAKVALMKLKSSAIGDTGVPMESRVYLDILLPGNSTSQTKHSSFWIDQEWTIGRSIDYISDKAKVRNDNNRANCPKLRLQTITSAGTGQPEYYEMEQTLREIISSDMMYSGSTVQLSYVDE